MELDKIDMERLRHPSPTFKLFEPTEDKVRIIYEKFLTTPLFMSDETRNEAHVAVAIDTFMCRRGLTLAYEIGDFGGIFAFTDILPEWKAGVALKMWDKSVFGATSMREAKSLIRLVVDTFGLKRLYTNTADPIVVKLTRLAGFENEGVCPKDFMWDGQLYDRYLLGLVKED